MIGATKAKLAKMIRLSSAKTIMSSWVLALFDFLPKAQSWLLMKVRPPRPRPHDWRSRNKQPPLIKIVKCQKIFNLLLTDEKSMILDFFED